MINLTCFAETEILKVAGEDIAYTLNFHNILNDQETLASVNSVSGSPSGLTLSGGTLATNTETGVANTAVSFRCSAGTINTDYVISVSVTTSASNIRIEKIRLKVR